MLAGELFSKGAKERISGISNVDTTDFLLGYLKYNHKKSNH